MCKTTDELLNRLEDSINEMGERVCALETKVEKLTSDNTPKAKIADLCDTAELAYRQEEDIETIMKIIGEIRQLCAKLKE